MGTVGKQTDRQVVQGRRWAAYMVKKFITFKYIVYLPWMDGWIGGAGEVEGCINGERDLLYFNIYFLYYLLLFRKCTVKLNGHYITNQF